MHCWVGSMDDGEEIQDCDSLKAACEQAGDSPPPRERRRLIKRAVELGCTEHVPDSWEAT